MFTSPQRANGKERTKELFLGHICVCVCVCMHTVNVYKELYILLHIIYYISYPVLKIIGFRVCSVKK